MSRYLLDTNVVSELTRHSPAPQVVSFLSEQDDLWLSSIVVHELEYGLRLLPQGRRRSRLSELQSRILVAYEDRILLWMRRERSGPPTFGRRPAASGDRST